MKKKAKAVRVKEEDSQQSRPLKTERVEEVVMSSLEGGPSLSTRREEQDSVLTVKKTKSFEVRTETVVV
ncbi:MAG: hypothetical protein GY820_28390 [Gammaproteobacteria bacterium]|nr:hypothetical protein [Gammaproteobacteria bacterium]